MTYKYSFTSIANQISRDLDIIDSTSNLINNLIIRLATKIITGANKISILSKKKIISVEDIKTSVLIIINRELAKYSISDGTKAVMKYRNRNKRTKMNIEEHSGLQLSFATTNKLFQNNITKNKTVYKEAIIYLTAVLEFISAEIIELSHNASNNDKLLPRHIFIAISNDEELNRIFKGYILGTGTLPNINDPFKGGAPPKAIRDTIQHISKSALQKLMLRVGIKYKSSLIYEDSRSIIKDILEQIVCNTIHITNNKKRKTVKYEDGITALDILNIEIYGDKEYPGKLEPCKGKTKVLDTTNSKNKKLNILDKIKKYQETECTLLPHLVIHKLIKEIGNECNGNQYKYEQNYIWFIQAILEDYMVELYKNSLLIASHCNRLTVMPKDMILAKKIKDTFY